MYLQKLKPFNSSTRFQKTFFFEKSFFLNRVKNLFFSKKNKSGRSLKTGKIVIFSKSRSNSNNFVLNRNVLKNIKFNTLYFIFKLKYIKKRIICILKDSNGSFNFSPFINGTFLNDYFFFLFKILKSNFVLGKKTFLILSLNNFFISNINNRDYSNNTYIARSNGTFCLKKNSIKDFFIFIISLPSKKKKIFNWFNTCFIGRNSNTTAKYSVLGNYRNSFLLKKRQSVRGVAMNPVDHPHGGRTKTNKPEVSPWGWVTKKSH